MKVLSLFSGVGGFDLGLERAGMETVFQCEWDKHATKILQRHWPHVPRWDDISTLTGEHILQHAPVIDVVAWGSPCQDLSVAGKRAGLEGARSGLFHQGVRIIKELRELTNGKYPRISIWENVAGALSSGAGADFGQVLHEMDEAGACFSEWRLLDAQYFGVPQRRRRVFLVSVFDPATAARCPDPLLPLSESLRRDTQTGTTTGQEPANETATGVGNSGFRMRGFGDYEQDNTASAIKARDHKDATDLVVDESPILIDRAAFNQGHNALYEPIISDAPVVPSLVARGPHAVFTKGKRAQSSTDDETWDENRPAPTLNQFDQGDTRATTVVVSEHDRTYRQVTGALLGRDSFGPNHEGARDGKLILEQPEIIAFASNQRSEVRDLEDRAVALQSEPGMNQQTFIAAPIGFSHTQGLSAQPSEQAWPTLGTEGNDMAVAIPTLMRQREGKDGGGKGPLLSENKSLSLLASNEQTLFQPVEAAGFKPGASAGARTIGYEEELSPSLEAGGGGNNKPAVVIQYDGYNQKIHVDEPSVTLRIGRDSSDFVAQPAPTTMAVRRLTPLECERLMGWPDDWTAGQADTHRYKQCGNGVASPVATWLGQQLINL